LKFERLARYYLLKIIRLKGEPHELAMGMTIGVFVAMLPIMPFHIILAVALALFFRASKITAVIGCWASNPFNWYIVYFLNYRIGAFVLGLKGDNKGFASIIESMHHSEDAMELVTRIASSSGNIIAAFLIGGIIMGIAAAIPSYFIFLKVFGMIKDWRRKRKERKIWRQLY
jgi:uncharacterized protein